MSKQSLDFKELNKVLLNHIHRLVPEICPGGKVAGQEYQCGSIYGGQGTSFSINMQTGMWADFAIDGHKGGDIISLYAAVNNVNQGQAAKSLAESVGFTINLDRRMDLPTGISAKNGKPSGTWVYRDKLGYPTHITMRYNLANGKKTFSQWHFDSATDTWVPKATPTTPLFNLNVIATQPDKIIVICEGEKSAEAAGKILGAKYVPTCWIGGAQAVKKVDLSPLYRRDVLVWPDNDIPGMTCMTKITEEITAHVKTLKLIRPRSDDEPSIDAADLLEIPDARAWARDRVEQLKPLSAALVGPVTKESVNEVILNDRELSQPNPVSVAFTNSADEIDPVSYPRIYDKWSKCELQLVGDKKPKPYETEENISRILSKDPLFKDAFYYDEFNKGFYTTYRKTEPVLIDKNFEISFKMYLQREYLFCKATTSAVKDALSVFLTTVPTRNPMKEHFEKSSWDGTGRIDSFFQDIYGADNSEYIKDCGRIFWLSLMRRMTNPGIKVDTVIILEGAQGIKKSTSLELIAGKHYVSAGKDITNKDFFLKMKAKTILEIAELNAFSKADHNELKEVVSTATDEFRIPYGIEVKPYPRTCVFVGTTNETNYLSDETGARRYLPVPCTKVEFDKLEADLDQYYAEAWARSQGKEDHWSYQVDEHRLITESRSVDEKDIDPWYEVIADWVDGVEAVKVSSIFNYVLFIHNMKDQAKRDSIRIGKIMRKLGYKYTNTRYHGELSRSWLNVFPDRNKIIYKTCRDKITAIQRSQVLPPPTYNRSY